MKRIPEGFPQEGFHVKGTIDELIEAESVLKKYGFKPHPHISSRRYNSSEPTIFVDLRLDEFTYHTILWTQKVVLFEELKGVLVQVLHLQANDEKLEPLESRGILAN